MAADTPGTTALAAEFAQLERDWADGVVRQDRAALEGLLAPDYALVVSAAPDRPVPQRHLLHRRCLATCRERLAGGAALLIPT